MTTVPYERVDHAIEQVTPTIQRIVSDVWQFSELSLQEVRSARLLMQVLQENGFRITSRGTAGVPTAFIAEYGSGTPILGFLAEYDALPGLGNEAVPYREPRKDGVSSGHGCGHNLLGAGCVGAAIALKQVMAENAIPGTIRVYGCAAEETEGAKVYMAREGLFRDLDVALHWHPGPLARVSNYRSTAVNQLKIEFFGKSAHAAGGPWLGRSAVHAAELFAHGLNLMREHLEPTARMHYIYESAGMAPNVVPDYARLILYIRDSDRPRVEATTAWVKQVAEGAALATQTSAKVLVYTGLYDLLPNTPLAARMQEHLERVGIPAYTEEEQAFARELQQNIGVEPEGMTSETHPLGDENFLMGASTDVGDVSWNVPTMGYGMPTMPLGVAVHTWAATACHGMSIGFKGALQAARALALAGLDVMTDAELRQAARDDFERRVREHPYVSPLPAELKRPLGIPAWLDDAAIAEA
ncbi:MAG TPA: amidohydrolase [Ktedonobacteraceae bacterium]|jgi:aminobenzoyl-glutamate utilization protein B|nr:amidohydrolase [Ktedonobacteraceae bacterium]